MRTPPASGMGLLAQVLEQRGVVLDEEVTIGLPADQGRWLENPTPDAPIDPIAVDAQFRRQAMYGPPPLDPARQAMFVVTADPVMLAADFQDSGGRYDRAAGGAKPLGAQHAGDVAIGVTLLPEFVRAADHLLVTGDGRLPMDRGDHGALGKMPADPDDFHLHAIRGGSRQDHPLDQAAQELFAMFGGELLAGPEGRQRVVEVLPLVA